MSRALAWLAQRESPPLSLRQRIEEAVLDAESSGDAVDLALPALLARAGLERLRVALALGDERGAAFDLLAADALLTYACEAAAELGEDALARLQQDLAPDRFAALLPPG